MKLCKKCSQIIPNRIDIDGKIHNLSSRIYCLECIPFKSGEIIRKDCGLKCIHCGKELIGQQKKFCSRKCQKSDPKYNHQSYQAQSKRGLERKKKLIALLGGKCIKCGYNKNIAALEFHHVNPIEKKFPLDIRSLSNRKWDTILEESNKCELFCANCHREEHNPEFP